MLGYGLLDAPAGDRFLRLSSGSEKVCGVRTDETSWLDVLRLGHHHQDGPFIDVSVSGSGDVLCGLRPDGSASCASSSASIRVDLTRRARPAVPAACGGVRPRVRAGRRRSVRCWGSLIS